jgi:uncharacterized repeat protein (TIGR04076 family)
MPLPKVKITVLKRTIFPDVVDEFLPSGAPRCEVLEDGQEFFVDDVTVPPEGFCEYAYADLHRYIVSIRNGDNFGLKEDGMAIACCTDGFRPVLFKIERIEQ